MLFPQWTSNIINWIKLLYINPQCLFQMYQQWLLCCFTNCSKCSENVKENKKTHQTPMDKEKLKPVEVEEIDWDYKNVT